MSYKILLVGSLVLLAIGLSIAVVDAQRPPPGGRRSPAALTGTGFTYQGQLKQNGALVNTTCDFVFSLWDAASSGNQVGTNITQTVPVTNGLFTATLNAAGQFNPVNGVAFTGDARYLQIAVGCPSPAGSFTALSPRQALTPAPYALALPGLYTTWQNVTSPNIIGGWNGNAISATVGGATISGGGADASECGIPCPNRVTDIFGTIAGGAGNLAGNSDGSVVNASYATVGGGRDNTASGSFATIGGGYLITASNVYATVSGGGSNTASGSYATVGGGDSNTAAGAHSFAAGNQAKANHQGAFVWADSNSVPFTSTANNQFSVRATGGARFVSAVDAFGNPTAGVQLASGGGAWSSISDRAAKDNFYSVNGRDMLARLAAIPIQTWNYKTQDASIRHIGPMAQDFHAAFNVGEDDTHITTVDADGVALAAIQGLYQVVQEKDVQIAAQQKQIDALQSQNADILVRLAALERDPRGFQNPSGLGDWNAAIALVIGALGVVAFERARKGGVG